MDAQHEQLNLEARFERRYLRMARLSVARLIFPTTPHRVMFGVGFAIFAVASFYHPWRQGALLDGLSYFLLLVIALCAMYLGGYSAKVAALQKLIEKECPALDKKIKASGRG